PHNPWPRTPPAPVQPPQPPVADGHPVRVPRQVLQHLLRAAERRLGVHDPVAAALLPQSGRERRRLGQGGAVAVEGQRPRRAQPRTSPREARLSPRPGKKTPGRPATQRGGRANAPPASQARPPPVATTCRYGWSCRSWPQVCSTASSPTFAPRCFGLAATCRSACWAARNSSV